jgi:Carboxypeptidase regulatory-like domain
MYLPTFRELADSAFLSAHCFTYGGTELLGGANGVPALRVDFRPANRISVPDVEGSIYLDTTRFVVRRAVFRMTKPGAADPPVMGLSVTTTFRELVPLVPVFDSVDADEPLPAQTASQVPGLGNGVRTVVRSAIEEDRLITYTFEQRAPGQQGGAASPAGSEAMAPTPLASGATATTGATEVASGTAPLLTGRILGPGGVPVAGATVSLFGARDTTTTSDSGQFALARTEPGPHMMWVRRLGFEDVRFPVTVVPNRPRAITVVLARRVAVLPTVTTTAQVRTALKDVGFEQRMRSGMGQYLTYDQIQRRRATTLSQLLEGMRGIHVWQNPLEFQSTVEGTRGIGSCVSFAIDGTPQAVMNKHDIDNIINASEVAAIEVYSPAERPSGFSSLTERPDLHDPSESNPQDTAPQKIDLNAQQCTLVIIWTRGRLGIPENPDTSAPATERAEARARPVFPDVGACEPKPAEDTITVALYAALQGGVHRTESDTAWSAFSNGVLNAVRNAFIMPSDLPLPAFSYPLQRSMPAPGTAKPTATPPSLATVPALSSVIVFTLDTAGAVHGVRLAASSLSGPADTSLLAAVMSASDAHAFPPIPRGERGQGSVRFDLVVSTAAPDPGIRAAAFGRVLVPVWTLRRPATLAEGSQPSLASDGESNRIGSDSLTLEFVVNEQGRAVMSTVREIGQAGAAGPEDSQRMFLARVLRALPGFRFEPALIGACPVPEMMKGGFAASLKN